MSDRGGISKISNIKDSSNIYDKNNLRKKNNLYTEWNFPNSKGSSKDDNLMKNKKDSEKEAYENNSLDNDKIEIDFFRDIQENAERTKEEIIVCKIARGEYVSKEDLYNLNENNPELIKKAIVVGNQRKRLEEKLRLVNNNVEAQSIIFRYRDLAIKSSMSNDGRSLDGGVAKIMMFAAVEKAESKYRNNLWNENDIELEINLIEAGII